MLKIMHHIQKVALIFGIFSLLITPALLVSSASAQIPEQSKNAACQGLGKGSCDKNTAGGTVSGLVRQAINILSWVVGIVSIIMVIVGGFKFIVSNGDANGIKSARNTVIYALVGLAVAVLAQMLVRFVVNNIKPTPPPKDEETSMRVVYS